MRLDGQSLPVDGAQPRQVTLGVRPERPHPAAPGEGFRIAVTAIEELGATRLIHGQLGGAGIVAVQPAEEQPPESEAWLSPDPDALHLFDPQTGVRL